MHNLDLLEYQKRTKLERGRKNADDNAMGWENKERGNINFHHPSFRPVAVVINLRNG